MIKVVREDSRNQPFYEFCRKCDNCKVTDGVISIGSPGVKCKSKPKMQWVYDGNFCKTQEEIVLQCANMKRLTDKLTQPRHE